MQIIFLKTGFTIQDYRQITAENMNHFIVQLIEKLTIVKNCLKIKLDLKKQ